MPIQNFDQFEIETQRNESIFQLDESGSMAKYNLANFKNLFRNGLLESGGVVDEELLEKAHVCYEIAMLTEAKSYWFDTDGEVLKIDAGDHVILIKNNEAFIIAANTLNAINEWLSWADIRYTWDAFTTKVSNFAKEKIQQVKSAAIKTFDTLSDGAKKAWNFLKTCTAAVAKFLREMTWVEWASLGLGVLTAIVGLLGTAIPGATLIAGILMCLNGSIHLVEGYHKYKDAKDVLSKYGSTDEIAKAATAVSQALPNMSFGTIFMILGFNDLSHGLSDALANPAAGSVSLAIKGAALKATKSYVAKSAVKIEKIMGDVLKEALNAMDKKITAKVAGMASYNLIAVWGEILLSRIMGWLWRGLLRSGKQVTQGISFLLGLPQKLSSAIGAIQKNATSDVGKIVAKALGTLIKPMMDSAARSIAKNIKPWIQEAKDWFDRQIIASEVCEAILKNHKGELESGEEEVPEKIGKSLIKGQAVDIDDGEIKKLEGLPNVDSDIHKAAGSSPYQLQKAKTNESVSYHMKHLALFRKFDIS